jgi:hypothetical protein
VNTTRRIAHISAGILIGFASCIPQTTSTEPGISGQKTQHELANTTMKITIVGTGFDAILEDNPTTVKLRELLPLTLQMSELNGNEKFFHLSTALPTNDSKPGKIHAGDLMLWGDDSLVLFLQVVFNSLQLHATWPDRRPVRPCRSRWSRKRHCPV